MVQVMRTNYYLFPVSMKIKVAKISLSCSFESLVEMKRQHALNGDKTYRIQLHLELLCLVESLLVFGLNYGALS